MPEELRITYQATSKLQPRKNSPRSHSSAQIRQIAKSIESFGWTNPVLVDDQNMIIAGEGRRQAAVLLGQDKIPTIRRSDMSEAQIRAYVLADNKLAEYAGWDRKLLALEFQYLKELDLEFDLTLTGFELPEIDLIIAEQDDSAEAVPATLLMPNKLVTTVAGDIWLLGKHRFICGDATDASVFERLMEGKRAQMIFSDPPYNVPIDGHVSGNGAVTHREFAMACGEMSDEQFTSFLMLTFDNLVRFSEPGSIHYQCIDWRHISNMHLAGEHSYTELKNICVWVKHNAGMGSMYRSQHELVFVFKSGGAPHINNIALGKHGRNRSNVWTYAGLNSFGKARSDLQLHPTVKPVELITDAIWDCSRRGGIVLDPFLGSGSTLLAAEKAGRIGYGIELDPAYCDVVVRRLEAFLNQSAILATTGETFETVMKRRAAAGFDNAA